MTATVSGLTIATARGAVLDTVDLDLHRGEVTAIVGESGAGKTTLAHALLGHVAHGLRRTAGRIEVTGHDPFTGEGRAALRGRTTGYLPQDPASALDPRRMVLAQLRTAARIAHPGEARRDRDDRVRAAAEAAALDTALLRRHPARLSGGQAQRALLAWTFVTRPRLVILDEPTGGLDPDAARRVSDAFTRLPWEPAVLLVSHDRALVDRAAHRVLELAAGRLRHAPAPASTVPDPSRHRRPNGPVGAGERALSAEGLTIRRGGVPLLRDASLHLAAGEMVAVRGVSGSGKTSLARALCGLAPPDAGRLRMDGAPVHWDGAVRARTGGPFLAYVGQDARAALNPHEIVRRTLARASAAAHRRGIPPGPGPEPLLDGLGLAADVLDRTPDRLSGGQRHRVVLARALAAVPSAVVCDETLASLDHTTVRLVLDVLDAWRRATGSAVLLITHQDEVAARADRVLTLSGGRLE
ncbi:ABC transporter ATP-binding protein [Actinomadura sp. KC345]|uniref:ABC transporter ATP-binding protein n=1 Tax=Actinomadura sp. KC345 TaxID=2530371 RepID=UPI0010477E7A|nr:ATP-binding cassette domain-containing protein [Actinomadura sp. KC345]TDC55950.1 ABC transporter ATP-binding protein [Actinomadura sp. KC345]